MTYSLAAKPSPATLGTPVTLTLRAAAETDAAQALTFDHKSLTIELSRPGWNREARVAFPNRRVIEDKGLLLREGSSGGIEDLKSGEERTRDFRLEELFPLEVLDTGEFIVTFSLANEAVEIRPEAARLRIVSGPAAVPALFDVLEENEPARRARAAALLHRMTLHGLDYDPFAGEATRAAAVELWGSWWDSNGVRLPWNYESDGATFGVKPRTPPPRRLSNHVGGIAFEKAPWSDTDRQAVLRALEDWRNKPAPASLRGRERVADATISYPQEGAVAETNVDIERTLSDAIGRLGELARLGEDHAAEAAILLATVAAVPSATFAGPLTQLANIFPGAPEWALARTRCQALQHVLIPDPNGTRS